MRSSINHLTRGRIVFVSVLASLLAAGVLGSVALQSAAVAEGDDEPTTEAAESSAAQDDDSVASHINLQDIETYELTLNRDPFRTVRPEEVETASTESGSSSTGGNGEESGGSTSGSTGTESQPACTVNGELVCDGRVVSVLSTVAGGDSAVIQVDGATHQVTVGETFAESFRLLAIDADGCARIVYGDEAFTQCPGDTFLK